MMYTILLNSTNKTFTEILLFVQNCILYFFYSYFVNEKNLKKEPEECQKDYQITNLGRREDTHILE